jgi:hypothetical protein
MSTSYEMDEIMPVEVGHGGDYILISLEEFDRYLTIFEELLEDMDRSEELNPQTALTSEVSGGRITVTQIGDGSSTSWRSLRFRDRSF